MDNKRQVIVSGLSISLCVAVVVVMLTDNEQSFGYCVHFLFTFPKLRDYSH